RKGDSPCPKTRGFATKARSLTRPRRTRPTRRTSKPTARAAARAAAASPLGRCRQTPPEAPDPSRAGRRPALEVLVGCGRGDLLLAAQIRADDRGDADDHHGDRAPEPAVLPD